MKTTAGRIPTDWLDKARQNETDDSTISDWVAEALNSHLPVEVNYLDGTVYVFGINGATGVWLSQECIDNTLARIEAGI